MLNYQNDIIEKLIQVLAEKRKFLKKDEAKPICLLGINSEHLSKKFSQFIVIGLKNLSKQKKVLESSLKKILIIENPSEVYNANLKT